MKKTFNPLNISVVGLTLLFGGGCTSLAPRQEVPSSHPASPEAKESGTPPPVPFLMSEGNRSLLSTNALAGQAGAQAQTAGHHHEHGDSDAPTKQKGAQ